MVECANIKVFGERYDYFHLNYDKIKILKKKKKTHKPQIMHTLDKTRY